MRNAITRGATTVEEIAARCGAGSKCGGCWPELERILHEQDATVTPITIAVA